MRTGEWIETKLDGYVNSVSDTFDFFNTNKVVFLNTSDIYLGKIYKHEYEEVLGLPGQAKKSIRKGDVLFSEIRPANGRYAIVDFDADEYVVSTKLMVLRCSSELNNRFLMYFLSEKSMLDYLQMIAESRSGTFPQITFEQIKNLDITLPPLPEQKAIASILSSLDDKIDLLNRQNKTLEALAETYFRQWFIEETGEDWEEVILNELVDTRDGTHDSPKPVEHGYYLVTSKHMNDNFIDFGSAYKISEDDFINVNKRSKVERYDILISMIGTIGRLYLVTDSDIQFAIKNVGLYKTSQNKEMAYYLFLYLKSPNGKQFIAENSEGSTQEYVALGSLRQMKLKSPPKALITEFNNLVEPMFNKLISNSCQIRSLTALRDILLPKLISGEVRVNM